MAGAGFEDESSGRAVIALEATKILEYVNFGWMGKLYSKFAVIDRGAVFVA